MFGLGSTKRDESGHLHIHIHQGSGPDLESIRGMFQDLESKFMAAIDEVEREVGELKTAVAEFKGRNETEIANLKTEIEALKANGVDVARLEAVAAELDGIAAGLAPAIPATPPVAEQPAAEPVAEQPVEGGGTAEQ